MMTSDEYVDADSVLRNAAIIVLFGPTGSGKTTFANVASDSSMKVGRGLRSCTRSVEPTHLFVVDGKAVVVIDCPGFDDTFLSDTEILKELSGFLAAAYSQDFRITGLIYMHKITDTRVGGTSVRHMNMFRKLCGTESLKNVVYATNMWSQPPTEDELLREVELKETDEFFGEPLADGAQMARHLNTRESAHDIIRLVLDRNPTVPKIAKELEDEGIDLDQTEAGRALGNDLENEMRKMKEEMEELRKEHERKTNENDRKWEARLEERQRKGDEKYQKLQEEMESLKQGHANAKATWAGEIDQVRAETTKALERLQSAEAQNVSSNKTIGDLERKSREMTATLTKLTNTLSEQTRKTKEKFDNMEEAHKKELAEAKKRRCIIM